MAGTWNDGKFKFLRLASPVCALAAAAQLVPWPALWHSPIWGSSEHNSTACVLRIHFASTMPVSQQPQFMFGSQNLRFNGQDLCRQAWARAQPTPLPVPTPATSSLPRASSATVLSLPHVLEAVSHHYDVDGALASCKQKLKRMRPSKQARSLMLSLLEPVPPQLSSHLPHPQWTLQQSMLEELGGFHPVATALPVPHIITAPSEAPSKPLSDLVSMLSNP